jgi:hypothetical protein
MPAACDRWGGLALADLFGPIVAMMSAKADCPVPVFHTGRMPVP